MFAFLKKIMVLLKEIDTIIDLLIELYESREGPAAKAKVETLKRIKTSIKQA
jgi:hypothetical protein